MASQPINRDPKGTWVKHVVTELSRAHRLCWNEQAETERLPRWMFTLSVCWGQEMSFLWNLGWKREPQSWPQKFLVQENQQEVGDPKQEMEHIEPDAKRKFTKSPREVMVMVSTWRVFYFLLLFFFGVGRWRLCGEKLVHLYHNTSQLKQDFRLG